MLIKELTLQGILSFGPNTPSLEMRPLNVLVGPNGSGKSNLIEAINLIRHAPTNLAAPMQGRGGSGVSEWIWKGKSSFLATIANELFFNNPPLKFQHRIEFVSRDSRFELIRESIECFTVGQPGTVEHELDSSPIFSYHRDKNGTAVLGSHGSKEPIGEELLAKNQSFLTQLRNPLKYPALAFASFNYERIKIYREWTFGKNALFRSPQPADMPFDSLEEDFSNLGLFLNHLRGKPAAKRKLLENLRALYEGLDDYDVRVAGGTVQVFLTEGDFIIPASRLSDGTLRYLCLLAILCDPDPPPLICIEEPELGLHPDLLPKLADLLIEASERTQLIVTTHSDILIDAMTEQPESVVIFEKHDGQTTMQRLEEADLKKWLDKYRLGELWTRGDIGGNRW